MSVWHGPTVKVLDLITASVNAWGFSELCRIMLTCQLSASPILYMSVSVLFSFFSFALLFVLLQSLIDLPSGFVFLYAFDVCYFSTEHAATHDMTVDWNAIE